jgi:uncharacterized repeat protein (TIGR01451 family)
MERVRRPLRRGAASAAGVVTGLVLALVGAVPAPALAAGPAASGAHVRGIAGRVTPAASPADGTTLAMSASVSPSPLVIGESAVYTVTVRNTGIDAATNVVTTLPFTPAGAVTVNSSALPTRCGSAGQTVTCTEATIATGGSVTYTIPVTVLASDSDGTNIALRATATADGGVSASADLITQAFTRVDVQITKDGPAKVGLGGTITYTITVQNNGPSNAVTVNWTDPTNGNLTAITSYPCGNTGLTVTCQLGTMTPGQTRVFELTVKVNGNVPAGTVITNCATVDTGTRPETNPDNNRSCTDTYVDPPGPVADVEVTKTGPATAHPGGTITYSLSVTNHGPDPATQLIVTDPLDEPLVAVQSLPAGCTARASIVTCHAGALAVGETKTFTFTVTVAAGLATGTQVSDCAQATSRSTLLRPVQGQRPCVQTVIVARQAADVAMAKAGPATADPVSTYDYTLTATNNGPDAAANVIVTDATDPALVTVVALPAGCTQDAGTVTCDAGPLAAGGSRAFTITVQVNPGVTGVVIINCAQVRASTHDPDLANNVACADTTVDLPDPPSSDVRVVKHGPAVVHQGETTSYSVDVTNLGPDDAAGVIVIDPVDTSLLTVTSLPAGCALRGGTVVCLVGGLAVGQAKTLTFSVVVAAAAAPGTLITNCAAAVSRSSRLTRPLDLACVQTVVLPTQLALLEISKSAPAQVLPDGMISYTVSVTNHGPSAAAGVNVKDSIQNASLVAVTSLPSGCTLADGGGVTCELGTLAAGETRQLTMHGRVFADLADGTVIRNCASVYTTTTSPDLAGAQSCVTTLVSRTPFIPVTG